MKKIVLLLVLVFTLFSCKNDKKENDTNLETVKPIQNSNEISILDIEYLNDTLNIAVKGFKVIDLDEDNYEMEITMQTPELDKYSKDFKFFVHCIYYDDFREGDSDRLAVGTNRVKTEGDKIIFSRKFKSNVYEFETIRYGLLNTKTNERYFTLKLDSITLFN
jgi:hypothetical protein